MSLVSSGAVFLEVSAELSAEVYVEILLENFSETPAEEGFSDISLKEVWKPKPPTKRKFKWLSASRPNKPT